MNEKANGIPDKHQIYRTTDHVLGEKIHHYIQIADLEEDNYIGKIEAQEWADRIVACVNACAGIPTKNIDVIKQTPGVIVSLLDLIDRRTELQSPHKHVKQSRCACTLCNANRVLNKLEAPND